MGFLLNSSLYIDDTLLRQYLLGKVDPIQSHGSAEMIEGGTIIARKLNVKIPDLDTQSLVNTIINKININNIDVISSIMSLDRFHIIAIAYLIYEGRLSEENFYKILNSNNDNNRTEILLSLLTEKNNDKIDIFGPLLNTVKKMTGYQNPGEMNSIGVVKDDVIKKLHEQTLKALSVNINYGNYFYKLNDSVLSYCGNWELKTLEVNDHPSIFGEDTINIRFPDDADGKVRSCKKYHITLSNKKEEDIKLTNDMPGSKAMFQRSDSLHDRVPKVSGFEDFWVTWGEAILSLGTIFNGETMGYTKVFNLWIKDTVRLESLVVMDMYGSLRSYPYLTSDYPLDKYAEDYKLGYSFADWWFNDKISDRFKKSHLKLRTDRVIADATAISLMNNITEKYENRLVDATYTKSDYNEIVKRSAIPHIRAGIGSYYELDEDSLYYTDSKILKFKKDISIYSDSTGSSEIGTFNIYRRLIDPLYDRGSLKHEDYYDELFRLQPPEDSNYTIGYDYYTYVDGFNTFEDNNRRYKRDKGFLGFKILADHNLSNSYSDGYLLEYRPNFSIDGRVIVDADNIVTKADPAVESKENFIIEWETFRFTDYLNDFIGDSVDDAMVKIKNTEYMINLLSDFTNTNVEMTINKETEETSELVINHLEKVPQKENYIMENYYFINNLFSNSEKSISNVYGDLLDFNILIDEGKNIINFGTMDINSSILKILNTVFSQDEKIVRYVSVDDITNPEDNNIVKILRDVYDALLAYDISTNNSSLYDATVQYYALRILLNYLKKYLLDSSKDENSFAETTMVVSDLDLEIYRIIFYIRHFMIEGPSVYQDIQKSECAEKLVNDPTGTNVAIDSMYNQVKNYGDINSAFTYALFSNNVTSVDSFAASGDEMTDTDIERILHVIFGGGFKGLIELENSLGINRLAKITELKTSFSELSENI